MGIKNIQDRSITAYKSEVYLGMSAEEAQAEGRSIFRDFKRIDNDNDGIISFTEIEEQRDKKHKKKNIWSNIFLGSGAYCCYSGYKLQKIPNEIVGQTSEVIAEAMGAVNLRSGQAIKRNHLILTLLVTGIGIIKKIKANNIKQETQKFRIDYNRQLAAT